MATDNGKTSEEEAAKPAAPAPAPLPFPDWAESAYRLYIRGQRNYTALGKQFGVDRETVKRWITKFDAYSRVLEDEQLVEAEREYLIGLQEVLGQLWLEHAQADNDSAKVGSLNSIMNCLEKIAVARKVVTERKTLLFGQAPDADPMQWFVSIAKRNGNGNGAKTTGCDPLPGGE